MAYPIFFCIFSKYIVLYVYKIKEEKTSPHQKYSLKIIKKYIIIYIVNEKRSYKLCIRLRSTSSIPMVLA